MTDETPRPDDFAVVALLEDGGGPALAGVLTLGRATAAARDGRLVLADVLAVPAGQSASELANPVRARREALLALVQPPVTGEGAEADSPPSPHATAVVRVGQDRWAELLELCSQEQADLLILPLDTADLAQPPAVLGVPLPQVLDETPCDLALVYRGSTPPSEAPRRVLLPVRGGPYARLALTLGSALAGLASTADVTLLHVLRPDVPERVRAAEEAPFERFLAGVGARARLRRRFVAGRDVSRMILSTAADHDWLIMGASSPSVPAPLQTHEESLAAARSPAWRSPGFFPTDDPLAAAVGAVPARIVRQAPGTIVLVRTRHSAWPEIETLRGKAQGPMSVYEPEALSALVDKWFAENTFSADEFADLGRLVDKKRRQGLTISLGLPALNEEATVGEVIRVLKETLLDEVPLLDEIVLIDSGSSDATVEIARAAGIRVVDHRDILPEAGPPLRGKGEALWKSLAALKGDLIVWVDTDIENMAPHFVYGLIGPLLAEPRIQYVKGYYRRPIRQGETLVAEGGGRVTELTIRPLFNLFFPALSGLIQPLAGEYAGRRAALEQVPFFSGYGVETGLLIDLLDRFGLGAIAQVNLGERVHRNQSLGALSVMAFAIMQVILQRLEEHRRVHFLEDVNRSMKLIQATEGQLHLTLRAVRDIERPPMRQYRVMSDER